MQIYGIAAHAEENTRHADPQEVRGDGESGVGANDRYPGNWELFSITSGAGCFDRECNSV